LRPVEEPGQDESGRDEEKRQPGNDIGAIANGSSHAAMLGATGGPGIGPWSNTTLAYRAVSVARMPRIACALVLALAGCSSLPADADRPRSTALGDTAATRLGRAIAPAAAANTGKSGIYALGDGRDAFAARVLLARAAEKSLDVQY